MSGPRTSLLASSLEVRIQDHYGALPASERKVADLFMDFPGQIASYSATELAGLAGASKAAVTRLCHRLGYDGFEDMRRAARDSQQPGAPSGAPAGSPLYLLSQDPEDRDFAALVHRQVQRDTDLLTRTFANLDPDVFAASVAGICKARRVFIAGWRNSQYLAGYLRWQLIQVRDDVHVLPHVGETLGENFADLTAKDLLVVFGFRRRVGAVAKTRAHAARKGAKILYFSDQDERAGAIDDGVNWAIRCPIMGGDALDHYAGAMSLMHFYAMAVMRKMGGKGRARLAAIEQSHEALHEFG